VEPKTARFYNINIFETKRDTDKRKLASDIQTIKLRKVPHILSNFVEPWKKGKIASR